MRNQSQHVGVSVVLFVLLMTAGSSVQADVFLDFKIASELSDVRSPGNISGSVLPKLLFKHGGSIKGQSGSLGFSIADRNMDQIGDTLVFSFFDGTGIDPAGEISFGIERVERNGGVFLTFPVAGSSGTVPDLAEFFPFLPNPEQLLIPAENGLEFTVPDGSLTLALDDIPVLRELIFGSSFEADEAPEAPQAKGSMLTHVLFSGEPLLWVDSNGNGIPEPDIDDPIGVRFDSMANTMVVDRDDNSWIFNIFFEQEFSFIRVDEVAQYPLEGPAEITNARSDGMICLFFDGVLSLD
ncbi:MAG: hypothetical protein AAGE01_20735 [Pseudomonadota bacterium]